MFFHLILENSSGERIDVSVHNGTIDWQKVKDTGLDFAILRAGYGRFASQKDTKFEDNYAGAKAVGLPIGAYWYSYATTPMKRSRKQRSASAF